MVEIREILRLWQLLRGHRTIADALGVDRKTVRRYVEAAIALGVQRDVAGTVDDAVLGQVIEAVRPGSPAACGDMREHCRRHTPEISGWVRQGCRGPKLVELLARHSGIVVPLRTIQRFIGEELAVPETTVRVADPPPGQVLEIDFAELGRLFVDGKWGPKLHALICTPTCSRYAFVWPCLDMELETMIEGLEAAWAFFGGVFPRSYRITRRFWSPRQTRFRRG